MGRGNPAVPSPASTRPATTGGQVHTPRSLHWCSVSGPLLLYLVGPWRRGRPCASLLVPAATPSAQTRLQGRARSLGSGHTVRSGPLPVLVCTRLVCHLSVQLGPPHRCRLLASRSQWPTSLVPWDEREFVRRARKRQERVVEAKSLRFSAQLEWFMPLKILEARKFVILLKEKDLLCLKLPKHFSYVSTFYYHENVMTGADDWQLRRERVEQNPTETTENGHKAAEAEAAEQLVGDVEVEQMPEETGASSTSKSDQDAECLADISSPLSYLLCITHHWLCITRLQDDS
ncbi:hypothetical protein NDU88_001869 [Pleurodeles waltl]|uniref:Uncharacterized protein n=1 Tax=Pleurodeles waltl TaxID=8319 RepID=A0AAV7Q768_PLEWA|nr:hypothetical protein NDU88_001869 [Pleurodeles waltl]